MNPLVQSHGHWSSLESYVVQCVPQANWSSLSKSHKTSRTTKKGKVLSNSPKKQGKDKATNFFGKKIL